MKFLLFNTSVIFALYYLFSGFEGFDSEIVKSKVSRLFNNTVVQASRIGDSIKEDPNLAEPKPNPVTVSSNGLIDGNQVREPGPRFRDLPISPAVAPQASGTQVSSTRGNNQALINSDHKTQAGIMEGNQSEFMSPQQRRRELNKLAEDMELKFISRLAK